MLIYWIIFSASLPGIIFDPHLKSASSRIAWISLITITIFVVGLRHRVGCDWQDYVDLYEAIHSKQSFGLSTLKSILSWGPFYLFLNWSSAALGLGIYFTNLVCAGLSIGGLSIFCRGLPSPWVGWTVAFPYFVVVITMGYTRQAVAIGLFFWALKVLHQKAYLHYVLIILFAAMFHISALILLPLALITGIRRQPFKYVMGFLVSIIVLVLTLGPDIFQQIQGYAFSNQHSKGGVIRSMMTLIPALIFLCVYREFSKISRIIDVWLVLSIASFLAFFAVWLASTAVDRMGLYLIAIQIFVWSSISTLPRIKTYNIWANCGLVVYSASVLFVWLNYGLNSRCWIPYNNLFFKFGLL